MGGRTRERDMVALLLARGKDEAWGNPWIYHFSCGHWGAMAAVMWASHPHNCLQMSALSFIWKTYTCSALQPLIKALKRGPRMIASAPPPSRQQLCGHSTHVTPSFKQTGELKGNTWLTCWCSGWSHTPTPLLFPCLGPKSRSDEGACPFSHNDIIIQTTGVYQVDWRCYRPRQPCSVKQNDNTANRFSLGWAGTHCEREALVTSDSAP